MIPAKFAMKADIARLKAEGVDWSDAGRMEYFRNKRLVAAFCQPKRILEIGVRAAYSAYCFLHACPKARYVGIDIDPGTGETDGGIAGAGRHARWLLDHLKADYVIHTMDSAELQKSPGTVGARAVRAEAPYDLVHIDGAHRFEMAFLDLLSAERLTHESSIVLVDDAVGLGSVRQAVWAFCRVRPGWTCITIDDLKGQAVLSRRDIRKKFEAFRRSNA